MKKLNFYFDFLSPFSYFAWLKLQDFQKSHDLETAYRPVLMGKLFSHHGFPGPGEIPAKRKYELKKCFRYAHKNDIKFHPPHTFPFNPLAIIRLATNFAAKNEQSKIIDCIFKLVWAEGIILEDPELIEKLLVAKGFNSNTVERSFEREAKTELKRNIKDALGHDIFGVPSFEIEEQIFWGNDSYEDLNNFLIGKNDRWDKELYYELLK
jgi:2-hydroxychromene-2-carboxylate isomerase